MANNKDSLEFLKNTVPKDEQEAEDLNLQPAPPFDETMPVNPPAFEDTLPVTEADLPPKFEDTKPNVDPASAVESAIGAAASAASFGLSDVAISQLSPDYAESQRLGRAENPVLSGAAEATAIIVPSLLTGGAFGAASAAAKAASTGVRAAAKAGKMVEGAAKKALQSFAKDTTNKSLAKEIVAKYAPSMAGNAVEAATYGAGSLISESALGNVDLNGENIIAALGTSALFGAGLSGAGKFIGSVAGKVPETGLVKTVNSKLKGVFNPEDAAVKLTNLTPNELSRNLARNPNYKTDLADFLKNRVGIKTIDSAEAMTFRNAQIMTDAGKTIDRVITEISKGKHSKVPAWQLNYKIAKRIDDEIIKPFGNAKDLMPKLKPIIKLRDSFLKNAAKTDIPVKINVKQLHHLRQQLGKDTFSRTSTASTLEREAAITQYNLLRNIIDDIAEASDPALREALKAANKDYHMASTFHKSLSKKAMKESFLEAKDIMVGSIGLMAGGAPAATILAASRFLKSDMKNRLAVMGGIQDSINKVTNAISSSFKGFEKGTKAGFIPASTNLFMKSNLAKKDTGEKLQNPNNKQQAISNLQDNLNKLTTDPQYFDQRVVKKFYNLQNAAPQTAVSALQTLKRGVDFLNSVVPKTQTAIEPFAKKPFISDYEFGQIARYVQAVEDPMSALTDLQNGTLTREQVKAVKTVYPSMYVEIVDQAMKSVQRNPSMQYQKKVQMGILLDIPADESLRPEFILAMQAQFANGGAAAAPQAAAPNAGKNQTGLNKINAGENAETTNERIIRGKD